MRYRSLALVALLFGVAVVVVVVLVPGIPFAWVDPGLHVAAETSIILMAGGVAGWCLARHRVRRDPRDLVTAGAIGMLAVANLALSDVPHALGGSAAAGFSTWAPIGARLAAGALLAIAGLGIGMGARRTASWPRQWFCSAVGVLAAVALVIALAAGWVPASIELSATTVVPISSSPDARVIAALAITAVCLVVAAAALARRADATSDEFEGWLACGCAVLVAAVVSYMLSPAEPGRWFHTGDLLRLAAYGCWVVGTIRDIIGTQRTLAVVEERRRIARDLHDGIAQELAFIATQATQAVKTSFPSELGSRDMPSVQPDPTPLLLLQLSSAAQRALDESRRAIVTLRSGREESLRSALAVAEEIAARFGMSLRLELDPALVVPARVREALVWIVREAMSNAGRHGRAHHVLVSLRQGQPVQLLVRDDGEGFDLDAVRAQPAGFGLTTISERAAAIGASLSVQSTPGGGTTLEVA